MGRQSIRVTRWRVLADRSEPVEPARHGGQQAADGGDLNGDEPEEILPVVVVQRDPALIHGFEFGFELAIHGFEFAIDRVEPAIHPVDQLLLPRFQPFKRGDGGLRDVFEDGDASFHVVTIMWAGQKINRHVGHGRLPW